MRKIEQINLVLSTINFNVIHTALTSIGRKFKFENEERVPTILELRSIAELCLTQIANSENESASHVIFGFEAEKIHGTYQISFILDRVNPLAHLLNMDVKNEVARKA